VDDVASEEAPRVGPYGELEPPEILAHNLQVGSRLAAAAQAFSLLAFVFAYLYLRTLNSNGDWRPKHVHPSAGLGVAIAACVVGCALAYWFALQRLGDGTEQGWRTGAIVALVLGLAVFGLVITQFAAMRFGPTSGGYASVFIGWLAFYALNLLLVLYWLETLVAQSLHAHTQVVAPETGEVAAPFELMRPAGDALAIVIYVMAAFGLLAWILLWLV
jgi:heme/copper-type cytochrome/quinol oxidase subunit 3